MKTNKVTKLGISLLSVAALGVVAPALIDTPIFGSAVVKAEETRPLEYTIAYYDKDTGEEIAPRKTGTINPGETVNIYKDIDGYQVVSNFDEWMPGFNATYRIVSKNFGFSDGRLFMDLSYKRLTPTPTPEPAPTPTPTPEPEVKPEPVPKAEEQKEPLKYRISYYDGETGKEITAKKTGVINPGETVNVYKDIDGYEVTSKDSWMPNYEATYDMVATYFHGDPDGYKGFYLDYKKLDADVKPSETPKPEVKPETKPSETPKPEVKPEPAPKAEETRPLEYRIVYYDKDTREEIAPPKTGTINPGEIVNIYKDIDGYQVVSNFDEWMPGFNASYRIMSEYFGFSNGRLFMYLDYKRLTPTPTPEPAPTPGKDKDKENPKPEVKPETKPSETPKPEVKPETKPSETPKPEVTPEPKPSETPKPEVKPETKPSETPKPEVKPEPKPSETPKPEVKPELKPQTNSNIAPTAPVKPVGQTSNSKADKPTSKKETPALPNTGEQSSLLSLVGLLLASLGLAGLTYKGRH